jgi:hypothetical protein
MLLPSCVPRSNRFVAALARQARGRDGAEARLRAVSEELPDAIPPWRLVVQGLSTQSALRTLFSGTGVDNLVNFFFAIKE